MGVSTDHVVGGATADRLAVTWFFLTMNACLAFHCGDTMDKSFYGSFKTVYSTKHCMVSLVFNNV